MAADLKKWLAEADARNGFPPGTMASVMQQESGGNSKFIENPAAYHYEAGADGRRIAKHTGKVSTAFGPFGILESTAADPGYGVKPLQSKDIQEQVRFAADYLAARSKSGGGLAAGLAGYGEGDKYAKQVVARLGDKGKMAGPTARSSLQSPVDQPAPAPQIPVPALEPEPVMLAQAQEPAPVQAAPAAPAGPDPWQEFLAQMQPQVAAQETGQAPMWGGAPAMPNFLASAAAVTPRAVDFRSFGRWGGFA